MYSARPLQTLWSLVCAKGGGGEYVPGKRCRDQQSPLGASERDTRAGRAYGDQRKDTDRISASRSTTE